MYGDTEIVPDPRTSDFGGSKDRKILISVKMKWCHKIFGCGSFRERSKLQNKIEAPGITSEPTRAEESVSQAPKRLVNTDFVSIMIHKDVGEVVGLRLFYHSLQIQSIAPDSAISQFVEQVLVGGTICSVNGKPATVKNVRNLLRECRYLSDVYLVLRRGPESSSSRVNQHRLSHSSATGSSSIVSPTPSQLSSMWRRASETATLPISDNTGVVAIDFNKLSRDSMGMWTRGIVRDSSLPELPLAAEEIDSFADEYGESPNTWRARRRAKRASWSGAYPEEKNPN
jgi:hypothetical protein